MKPIVCLGICILTSIVFFSCSKRDSESESQGSIIAEDSVTVNADSIEIDKILSTNWIEIVKEEDVWKIDDPCDSEPPKLNIQNDTINLSYGDGGFDSYKINSYKKKAESEWQIKAVAVPADVNEKGDTLTIYLKMIDTDKAFWKFGSHVNDYKTTFVNSGETDNYPKIINDCSGLDK